MSERNKWRTVRVTLLGAIALVAFLILVQAQVSGVAGAPEGIVPGEGSRVETIEPLQLATNSPAGIFSREPVATERNELRREVLPEPGSVVGRVFERGGEPVPGVLVQLVRMEVGGAQSLAAEAGEGLASATTDADGAFLFSGLAPGRYALTTTHVDYAMVTVDWLRVEAGAPAQMGMLVLSPGGTIRGTVTDERGASIEGARVLALLQRRLGLGIWETPGPAARTDRAGRYEIRNVPAGRKVVYAGAEGFATDALLELRLDEGGTVADIDFTLERAQSITGQVFDAETGEPMEGVAVFASPARSTDPTRSTASTDGNGFFELAGLSAVEFRVGCGKEGYVPSETQTARGGMPLVFRLERNGGLRGAVIGPTGQPVPAFTVRCGRPEGEGIRGAGQRRTFADTAGRFEIDGLNPGAYRLEIHAQGYGPRVSPVFQLGKGAWQDGITISLEAEAVIVATAIDARTGEPLPDAVMVAGQGAPRLRTRPTFDLLAAGPTSPDGTFALEGLRAGRYWVEVSHVEFAPMLQWIQVSAGERLDLGQLALGVGGTVEGTVRDAERAPTLMARLLLRGKAYQASATTDADGFYRFVRVPPGRYELDFQPNAVRAPEATTHRGRAVLVTDGMTVAVDF